VKPRAPESGRSKTDLRRGRAEKPHARETPTTEAEQEFLFGAGTAGAAEELKAALTELPGRDDPSSRDDTPSLL